MGLSSSATGGSTPTSTTPPSDRAVRVHHRHRPRVTSVKQRADWTAGVLTARDDRGEHWVLHHAQYPHQRRAHGVRLAAWPTTPRSAAGRQPGRDGEQPGSGSHRVQIQRDCPDLPIVGRRTDTDKRIPCPRRGNPLRVAPRPPPHLDQGPRTGNRDAGLRQGPRRPRGCPRTVDGPVCGVWVHCGGQRASPSI